MKLKGHDLGVALEPGKIKLFTPSTPLAIKKIINLLDETWAKSIDKYNNSHPNQIFETIDTVITNLLNLLGTWGALLGCIFILFESIHGISSQKYQMILQH